MESVLDVLRGLVVEGEVPAQWVRISTPYDVQRDMSEMYDAMKFCVVQPPHSDGTVVAFWENVDGAYEAATIHPVTVIAKYPMSSNLDDLVSYVNKNLPAGLPPIDVPICLT